MTIDYQYLTQLLRYFHNSSQCLTLTFQIKEFFELLTFHIKESEI